MTMGVGGFSFRPSYNESGGNTGKIPTGDVVALRGEIERLLMLTEALWTFIQEQNPNLTDDDLIKRVAEIDLRDGKLDGRVAKEAREIDTCPKCNRPVGRKRPTCLYCGSALIRDPFER